MYDLYAPETGFRLGSRDRKPYLLSASPFGNFSQFYVIRNLLPALLELTCASCDLLSRVGKKVIPKNRCSFCLERSYSYSTPKTIITRVTSNDLLQTTDEKWPTLCNPSSPGLSPTLILLVSKDHQPLELLFTHQTMSLQVLRFSWLLLPRER